MGHSEPLSLLFKEYDRSAATLEKEFLEFLRFPSISTDPKYGNDVRVCCNWVKAFLEKSGLNVEIWEGSGHPVVYASWLKAGPDKPTVLIYNHYDVQPVDPLSLWQSPPFEPRIENGEVFARGAEDNKGQCFYVMAAVRWMLQTKGALPVNLKLCIEGEEECGSQSLSELLKTKRTELKADHLYIVDLGIHEKTTPAITLGVRGIVTMTVEVSGSSTDLHSGLVGGIVYNPNRALSEMLAKLYDQSGKVQVPGFYDEVEVIDEKDRALINFHFEMGLFQKMFGAEPTGGELSFSPMERAWVRPTVEINGMSGGYAGDGFKTVIPEKAIAKISCRLVPKQSPAKIAAKVEAFLRASLPPGLTLQVNIHHGIGEALRTDLKARSVQTTAQVLSEVFGKPCEYILSGGSIPIVTELARASGADVVLMGLGLPDDNVHAPNEHFGLDRIRIGFVTIAETLNRLGS